MGAGVLDSQRPRAVMGAFLVNKESFMATYCFEKIIEVKDGA